MVEQGLTKQRIISELTKSTHGALDAYVTIGSKAAIEDPEFFGHLIAWNEKKGQIRDSKLALPVVCLTRFGLPAVIQENALAHLALLSPRDLLRALTFARGKVAGGGGSSQGNARALKRLVERYLRAREGHWPWFERTALQHRRSLKTLYRQYHVKAGTAMVEMVLNGFAPNGTVFADVKNLHRMPDVEAAGAILKHRIPFLVAQGALGKRAKDPDLLLALIQQMSPTELTTNMKTLEKWGVRTVPALRAALEQQLQKSVEAARSDKGASTKATLKTAKAIEAVADEGLKAKLTAVQEKQLATMAVEGDWLVLGDKSGSMDMAIEKAREVAATLAKMVKGQVHLIFFDISPRHFDVTGMSLAEIKKATSLVMANGGTSIGCGLGLVLSRKLNIDGIAIVSDGAENSVPAFVDRYKAYAKEMDKEPPVYLYRMHGSVAGPADVDVALSMRHFGYEIQEFDLRGGFDYHSLPNIVQTMRTNRYSLVDEIMGVPLLTLDEVLKPRTAA